MMGEAEMHDIAKRLAVKVVHGTADERVMALAMLTMWFAVGAFIGSTATSYAEMLTSADFPDRTVGVIAGTIATIIAARFA